MTPLRQRMINDLTVRGLAANTQRSYLQSVTGVLPSQPRPALAEGDPRLLDLFQSGTRTKLAQLRYRSTRPALLLSSDAGLA